MTGIVMRSTGSWYEVLDKATGVLHSCRLPGKFKLKDQDLTNPIAVGDEVEFEPENESSQEAVIHTILARKNYIARQSPKSKHHIHLIASNIDQLVLLTTIVQPALKRGFIDRYLLTTEPQNIPVILLFNKSDLWTTEMFDLFFEQKTVYESIGYKVLSCSATNGNGIGELRQLLAHSISLFSGQSGVGKSSVLNAVWPELKLKTGGISDYSGKGTHTTTFAEMFHVNNSFIIDTPGIKTLSFNNLTIEDVAHNFREFFQLSVDCKFGSQCLHKNEPQCAVKKGLENGSISLTRYQNYLAILDEIEAQNYWERKKSY